MNKLLPLTACAALALTACASTASEEPRPDRVAEAMAGFKKTGETDSCIPLRQIDSIKALDENHFLVRAGQNGFYLNKPNGKCNNAGRLSTRIQYTTSLNQLCQNEIIRVVDNTTNTTIGSCSMGKFVKLERVEKG